MSDWDDKIARKAVNLSIWAIISGAVNLPMIVVKVIVDRQAKPPEESVLKSKHRLINGLLIDEVTCPHCQGKNERGQMTCVACGEYMLDLPTVFVPERWSPIKIQFVALIITMMIGMLLRTGDPLLNCISSIVIVAAIGQAVRLTWISIRNQ